MTHHGAKKAKTKTSGTKKEHEHEPDVVEEEEVEPEVVESENEVVEEPEGDFEPHHPVEEEEQEQEVETKTAGFSVTPATINFKSDSEHVQLKVTSGGKDVTSQVKFGSEDGSVAMVTSGGLVRPGKPGKCRISANSPNGSIAHVEVTVE